MAWRAGPHWACSGEACRVGVGERLAEPTAPGGLGGPGGMAGSRHWVHSPSGGGGRWGPGARGGERQPAPVLNSRSWQVQGDPGEGRGLSVAPRGEVWLSRSGKTSWPSSRATCPVWDGVRTKVRTEARERGPERGEAQLLWAGAGAHTAGGVPAVSGDGRSVGETGDGEVEKLGLSAPRAWTASRCTEPAVPCSRPSCAAGPGTLSPAAGRCPRLLPVSPLRCEWGVDRDRGTGEHVRKQTHMRARHGGGGVQQGGRGTSSSRAAADSGTVQQGARPSSTPPAKISLRWVTELRGFKKRNVKQLLKKLFDLG